jgi:predicted permease
VAPLKDLLWSANGVCEPEMQPTVVKFLIMAGVLAPSTLGGYLSRKLGWLKEAWGEPVMTFVFLAYSVVGLLSIWILPMSASSFWLPGLAAVHVILMTGVGLLLGKLLFRDRVEGGLFGISAGMGNNGFTMGAFVTYMLYGDAGLNLSSILCVMWTPLVVIFLFPIARAYSPQRPADSLGRLIFRSVFDWRSIGLPLSLAGIALSMGGVAYPAVLNQWKVLDILMWGSTALAYFGIGMRLHVSDVWQYRKSLAALGVARFVLAAGAGAGLLFLMNLTPWPLTGTARNVFLIQSFTSTAVTMVAMANMFHLRPAQASVLFVLNTFLYVLCVLPLVLWFFG